MIDGELALLAPANGQVIELNKINDPTFSTDINNDGFGLIPNDGEIVAPVSGVVSLVNLKQHTVWINTESGISVLVHIGANSNELPAKPLELLIKDGQFIAAGQDIATMNIKDIKDHKHIPEIAVVLENADDKINDFQVETGAAATGDAVAYAYGK